MNIERVSSQMLLLCASPVFSLERRTPFLYSLSYVQNEEIFYEFLENVQRLLNEINNKHNNVGFAFFNLWHLTYNRVQVIAYKNMDE